MVEATPDKDVLEIVVKSIVDYPKDVKVERKIDEMGVLLNLKVNPADMAKIIGRQGMTAKAIRTILRVIGAKNRARVNLKIEEPLNSSRVSQEEADKAVDEIVEDLKI